MPPKSDAERIAVVETKLESLDEKVDAHRDESQRAHASTQSKIDQQSVTLARIEERMEAEAKARAAQDAANRDHAWTPPKVVALIGAVGGLAATLGYGAPKAAEAAAKLVEEKPPVVQPPAPPQ